MLDAEISDLFRSNTTAYDNSPELPVLRERQGAVDAQMDESLYIIIGAAAGAILSFFALACVYIEGVGVSIEAKEVTVVPVPVDQGDQGDQGDRGGDVVGGGKPEIVNKYVFFVFDEKDEKGKLLEILNLGECTQTTLKEKLKANNLSLFNIGDKLKPEDMGKLIKDKLNELLEDKARKFKEIPVLKIESSTPREITQGGRRRRKRSSRKTKKRKNNQKKGKSRRVKK
jgi:hypothetical protein